MEDIIDIIVTETTNLIEITSQPTDEVIDVNIIDNREDITLNVTPSVVEININSLTGNFGVNWGDIEGALSNQTDLQNVLNAKADLVDGKVPSSQLPSYVDDVVEVANYASLPVTGEVGKIYITLDTNFIYRWTGSTYVEIKDSSAVWGAITGTLSNQTDLQTALNAKQNQLNGNGFVKASGTTITYDNSTYLKGTLTDGFIPYWSSTLGALTNSFIEKFGNFTQINGSGLDVGSGMTVSGRYDNVANAPKIYSSDESTGMAHIQFINMGGGFNIGVNKSTTNGLMSGASAYATVLTSLQATNLEFGTDAIKRLTINGSTGAITATSSISATNFILSGGTGNTGLYFGHTDRVVLANYGVGGIDFEVNGGTIVSTLFPSGNFGLGIALDAGYKLDVNGTARISGALSGTSASFNDRIYASKVTNSATITNTPANASIMLYAPTTTNYYGGVIGWAEGNIAASISAFDDGLGGALGLSFATGNNITISERVRITSTGAATFSKSVSVGNSGNLRIDADASNGEIIGASGKGLKFYTNDGVVNPLTLSSAGAATFSSSVGIGVTPSVRNLGAGLDLEGGASVMGYSNQSYYVNNGYYNNAWYYKASSTASMYFQGNDGSHSWYSAPSGTAGNSFSWTPSMTILASGNVGIGTTAPSTKLTVYGDWMNVTDGTVNVYNGSDGSGGQFGTVSNHYQRFVTNNTERMRITSSGNVGIGTSSPSQKLAVVGDVRGYKLIGGEAGVAAGNYTIFSNDDNVGYIDTVRAVNSGDFHFRFDGTSRANINRSTGAYTATSDSRLKTNILDSKNVLPLIDQIKVRSYNWIENNSYEPYGLIAQELYEILPKYVYKPKTEGESWGLSKAELVPMLVKAIQELKAELDTLKNK